MGILKTQFQQADTDAFLWVQKKLCKKQHVPVVKAISTSGDGWCYPIIAAIALIQNFNTNLMFLYACLLAYAMQVPLYILLKKKFKRNRPQDFIASFEAKIKPSDQFSFPSGHTAAAFVMATQIIIFFPLFSIAAIIWAILIGASRVLLGVHFPGDILAGLLLGILCSLLSVELLSLLSIF
ncbi:phosphatase PAP2 family protein [Aliikangiella marina]|uniref:undecaprenyl-diphosphate phosphatase n=1 Tax=Aliikangiella marina TaxID=1712262 RepID=A0A545T739_9GAMM|nr:phosphatase PAP2 family protein [Aliikangiella marina]TQV72995.1 phosphatase PAP2 family protein [Aliikangiella marina]